MIETESNGNAGVINITCTVCPVGCKLTAHTDPRDGKKLVKIEGNACARGGRYAETEILNPVRVLTSTVRLRGAEHDKLLPVRSSKPVPKSMLFEGMKLIKAAEAAAPVRLGDTIIKDFLESGTDLIACKSV